MSQPITKGMQQVLDTITDAKNGEISGWSVATWLNQSRSPEGVRERLRALTKRGLITMRRVEDKEFPDRLQAMYSVKANTVDEGEEDDTNK